MKRTDLDAIRDRIGRAHDAVQTAAGKSYETSYQVEGDAFITQFRAIGVKAPEQLEDEFLNLFVWTWSLKDYLKTRFQNMGRNGQEVEDIVNRSPALCYVSDIANRAKHGTLKISRSTVFAELVDVGYEALQDSIERIAVEGPHVTMYIKNSEKISIQATIRTNSGLELDALTVLEQALSIWEKDAIAHIASHLGT